MATNVLVLLLFAGLAAVLLGTFGYIYGRGRPRAMDLERIAELEAELTAAREELDATGSEAASLRERLTASEAEAATTRTGIDEHFEASAALFGRLAQDYRELFDHLTDSAQRLGVSEARTEAMVEGVRAKLLADAREADAESATTDAPAEPEEVAASAAGAPEEAGSAGAPASDVASAERDEDAADTEADDGESAPPEGATTADAERRSEAG